MNSSFGNIWSVARRELSGTVSSPVAYVFVVIFLLLAAFFTFMVGGFFERGQASLLPFFGFHPWLYLFLVPAVGMRMWAEERRSGTIELLLTLPITTGQAVVGKFLAYLIIIAAALALTFPVWLTVAYLGSPDHGVIAAGYVGSVLVAASFLAVTSFTSALTRNQVVSFILSVVVCLFVILCGWPPVLSLLDRVFAPALIDFVASFSVMTHFEGIQRGVLDLRDLIYFASMILFFLWATQVVLRTRRAGSTMMKNRKLPLPVSAGLSVVVLFALLVGVNVLVSHWSWRVDLTAERAFTLSEGTRKILADLPAPVQVRFYFNQSDEAMPMGLKNYAQNVNDLLGAMQQASGGNLQVQQLDPQPDSAAEESARLDGVDPQILPDGGRIYLGLALSQDDRQTALPFLAPGRERLLEYDLARAISSVTTAVRPVLGLLTPLPTSPTPGMMSLIDRPPSAGVFFDELRRSFEVREIPFASEEIPADIQTLLVVHPREISEATQYAIDQFVLRGGRLVAFLDPMCVMDAAASHPSMRMPPPSVSTLAKLLPVWGVEFNPAEIVVDMQNVGSTRRGRAPGILALGPDSVDPHSVVSGNVGSLFLALAGAFQGEPAEGLSKTTLVFSSPQSALSAPGFVQTSPEAVERDFKPTGEQYPLAIKLAGRFKTAFPQGQPRVTPEGQVALPDAATSPDATAPPGLQESAEPTAIYLVADVDMLFDPLAVAEMTTPSGRPVIVPANGNLDLAQTMVEQLAGGDALSAVRSRATRDRPFTVVKRLQAEAEGKFRDKIAELEKGLSETQTRLATLAQSQDPAQQLILTPEQEAEIKAFRAKEAAAKKELKEVRKTLRREVESLEQRVKWINLLAMPLLVATGGLIIALWRHRRQRAR